MKIQFSTQLSQILALKSSAGMKERLLRPYKKLASNQLIRMRFFLPKFINFQSELVQTSPIFDVNVYKPIDMLYK